ncbi:serine/threonine protein kinase, CMGC, CDC2/CDK subfamily [Paramarasmius palmivorus]|uniref:Serine/threonine protein kinase, CMGC, CDC2/CDK subfamily n=1 Tax=Paramarasmius palmivorus TaxID=297713 RepID=A0AAW0B5D8_9AGAR
MVSPSTSKRRTSRSPDPRPYKRQAPSTPEEGEVDDGSAPLPSLPQPQLVHALPPKPTTAALADSSSKSKPKIKFPFKTKQAQAQAQSQSEGVQNVFSRTSSPPPQARRERDDDRRYGDVKGRERRNNSRGDHWEPSRRDRDRRSRSRSRSFSPSSSEKHRLPSRRSPEPAFSPPRGRGYDREREDRHDRRRDRDRDRDWDMDYRDRDRDRDRRRWDDDRHYRPQAYSSHWDRRDRERDRDRDRDDYEYDYYPRRRSSSRSRHYDSYRPSSPDKDREKDRNPPSSLPPSHQDFARTPPGPPPPPSPTHPSESTQPPAPPSLPSHTPPPPPRTPPPIPPPDTRLAQPKPRLPEKPKAKAIYMPVNPPQAPPSDKYRPSDERERERGQDPAPPPRIRLVKRKPVREVSKKEELVRFGRVLKGCGSQDDYEATTKLGEGTFGEVHKALQKTTGRAVALKRILMHNENEGMPVTALREIKILKAMKHPCVIEILDMFIVRSKDNQPMSVYMVFPYMDHDLAGLLENERVKLQPSHIKLYMKQLLEGTAYMHRNHILHRDMKAANLLISNTGSLRIADFGLARTYEYGRPLDTQSRDWVGRRLEEKERKYTNCVVTRWYRPPELLMGARNYGDEVDIWGIGCILGEMFNRRPILPGTSDLDQLERIWQLCGTPNQHTWPNFDNLPGCEGITRWNTTHPRRVRQAYEVVGKETCDLLDKLLICNPQERITAEDALNHEYFWTDPLPADPKTLPVYEASHEFDKRSQRMHQRPPPAAPPHPHVPSLPPGQRYGHEPQHRAMSIPYQGLNGRGPIGFPPPVHYSNGGGPPGAYGGAPAPAPAPGRYDPRLPRAPSLARNGPYGGGGGGGGGRNGVGRPPPQVQRNTGPNPGPGPGPRLAPPGLPQRPADPQGRNAPVPAPATRGGEFDDRGGGAGAGLNYG